MTRFHPFSLLLVLILLTISAGVARADWTEVRDLVRSGEKLSDDDQKEPVFRKAYALAQKSVAANPKVSNEHLWMAAAAGRLAQVADTKERLALAKVVKESAERAIQLDPKNGPAYMTLGAWHYYMADLSWAAKTAAKALYGSLPAASFADAVTYLTKALANGSDNMVEIYFLRARSYEELDNDTAAQADYRRCVAGKARDAKELEMQKKAKSEIDD